MLTITSVALFFLLTSGASAGHPETAVNLGTAGNYAILTKAGVTTTTAPGATTSVTGDIGTSPIAATAITGFALTADSSNTFSTSSLVTGNVYAADYTPPTPSNLGTAILDIGLAITDAEGRTTPDFTELGAGDIEGMTLDPGLYKWSSSVGINSTVTTFRGNGSDVWILQIAGDLNVGDGASVILEGGAKAENIFWQIAGETIIGTTAHVEGIILCKTRIVFGAKSSMNGRALAQTEVTLIANRIVQP